MTDPTPVNAGFSGGGTVRIQAYDGSNPPTPPQFTTGWVRQDSTSQAVAVRTNIVTPDGLKDWGIMTVDRGGHFGPWSEVEAWTDLVTP